MGACVYKAAGTVGRELVMTKGWFCGVRLFPVRPRDLQSCILYMCAAGGELPSAATSNKRLRCPGTPQFKGSGSIGSILPKD